MRKNKGVTLIGFIFLAALVAGVGIVGFRAIPIYNEFFTVKKILKAIDVSSGETTPAEVRNQFDRKSGADYIYDIRSRDLDITKENGRIVISIAYTRTIPLIFNVSLLFDFEASNRK
ncbi:MAG: DUF4845 domain-containing protein [Betaproteobacteria bacterium]